MFNAGLAALGFATAKHNKNRGTPFEFRGGKGFSPTLDRTSTNGIVR
jgi:hypothetical protein